MPNTYTQITIHLIFAVKNRENLLKKSIRPELFKYMTGIVTNKNNKLLAINGVADHVHLLIGLQCTPLLVQKKGVCKIFCVNGI